MTTTDLLAEYKNGNYSVKIFSDGTKIREGSSNPKPVFPEAFDLKITNFCDLSSLCLFCHENSNKDGTHGNLFSFFQRLKDLPAGVEIAIGGGNPLSHPDLPDFLQACKNQGLICNLTVNQVHLNKDFVPILKKLQEENLFKGLGISLRKRSKNPPGGYYNPREKTFFYDLSFLSSSLPLKKENFVLHLIAGIDEPSLLDDLPDGTKILVLGYKKFRNGKTFFDFEERKFAGTKGKNEINPLIRSMSQKIRKHFGRLVVSFDNLAIDQLDIKRFFLKKESFDRIFMGEDGRFTMYVDLPNQKFAVSSASEKTYDFVGFSVKQMFEKIQKKEG